MALHHHDMVDEISHFEEGIKKWKELENITIAHSEKILNSTNNKLVRTIASAIKMDSEKHKEILDVIEEALTGTITLMPEELGEMSELLDEHMRIEKNSVTLGEEALEKSRHFVVRHLLFYILEDERKHFELLNQLNDFKKHLYPYA